MVSVCDDCTKKSICKPSKPYNFMCQWKNVEGKQRIAARDEWGLTAISNKFVPENRDEGWMALKLTTNDIDKFVESHHFRFDHELSHDEKMTILEHISKNKAVAAKIVDEAINMLLWSLYGDRLVEDLEETV